MALDPTMSLHSPSPAPGTGLNSAQLEAVHHVSGPCLVLAGAGSGKTRVITHKIGRLIQAGLEPERIAAITFTNKAAAEMRERAKGLIGKRAQGVLICTFHALGVRMLRQDGAALGLKPQFSILDSDDVTSLLKDCGGSTDAATGRGDADRTTDPDSSNAGVTIRELRPGQCFTFATATTTDAMGMRCGDMQAVMGLHVDVMARGEFLCLLPGTFTSLAAVPSDYSSCNFTPFLPLTPEGLVDRGMIAAIPGERGTNHYRVHIITNRSPVMRFSLEQID